MGDPVLRQRAEEVQVFDEELRQLVDDMFETMYAAEGIGLAAPQVGISKRLFVVDTREPGDEPCAVINPVIAERSGSERGEEGCLSLPGLVGVVERSTLVTIEAVDVEGNPLRIDATDLLARVMQHEIDHIDGVLFIDRLSPLKRKMLISKWKKLKREEAPR